MLLGIIVLMDQQTIPTGLSHTNILSIYSLFVHIAFAFTLYITFYFISEKYPTTLNYFNVILLILIILFLIFSKTYRESYTENQLHNIIQQNHNQEWKNMLNIQPPVYSY